MPRSRFNDGQIKGINLAAIARSIQSVLTGQAAGPGAATDFAELASTFKSPRRRGDAGSAHAQSVRAHRRPGADRYRQQSIDMRLAPRVVNSAQGQGGTAALAAAWHSVPHSRAVVARSL